MLFYHQPFASNYREMSITQMGEGLHPSQRYYALSGLLLGATTTPNEALKGRHIIWMGSAHPSPAHSPESYGEHHRHHLTARRIVSRRYSRTYPYQIGNRQPH